ncbi:MAG: hypothetical protein CME64_10185 [Halobacteriovoraceae bacterium]|nr:hypothetical protein [Halobacteriovoraceae bacterium]
MFFASFGFLFLFSTYALAIDCPLVEIKEFKSNPKSFMEAPLRKYDENCEPTSFSLFDNKSISDKSFIAKKDQARKSVCHTNTDGNQVCLASISPGDDVLKGRAPIETLDRAENLVDPQYLVKNINAMESLGLMQGRVNTQPWSDWYWPIAVGQLSFRYNDNNMMSAYSMKSPDENSVWTWVNEWHKQSMPEDVNLLSPSEKYDLLVGDTNYTLTKKMLQAGSYYQQNFGKVESWMGLCHGWAPASYMLPRPVKTLPVTLDNGSVLEFLPSDLKALGTLLWANGLQSTRMVGGRCNSSEPEKDEETGRVIDQNCFDTNPGTWHMATVSEIGKKGSPFVMDATFDYEVWNHPVLSYSYKYFNPKTYNYANTFEEGNVNLADFDEDKFKNYRSKDANSVVGIVMEVVYLIETEPQRKSYDSATMDAKSRVQYVYDLELDEKGNIIGGEWYTDKHPDFIWTPYTGSKANSVVDEYIAADQISLQNISRVRQLAPYASAEGQPIARVVEALMKAASE